MIGKDVDVISATIVAVNDATNSANPIHRDAEARSLGMRGGLVGGMTLYGYLSVPAVQLWGGSWAADGSMTARFRAPVYDGEQLDVQTHDPTHEGGERQVELVKSDRSICAIATIGPPVESGPKPTPLSYPAATSTEQLPLIGFATLSEMPILAGFSFQPRRDGVSPAHTALGDVAHPESIANASIGIMYQTFRAEGPRVHTGLSTKHFRAVTYGQSLTARGRIIEVWRHKNRTYAKNDVLVCDADDAPVMQVQNTTIWEFPG